jgi:hypothetical protein
MESNWLLLLLLLLLLWVVRVQSERGRGLHE